MKRVKRWSQKKLVRVTEDWQRLLGLRDWAVWVGYAKAEKIGAGRGAEIDTQMYHKQASISIVRPKDIPQGKTMDVETTIVHELLHIHIQGFYDHANIGYGDKMNWEQAVEALARALVILKRSKRRK